jgi:hypothetical protein
MTVTGTNAGIYLVIMNAGNATITSADDIVIQLVGGVVGTFAAATFVQ